MSRAVKLSHMQGKHDHERLAEARENSALTRTHNANSRALALKPLFDEMQEAGITTLNGMAGELNRRNVPTARGGAWRANSVSNALARIESLFSNGVHQNGHTPAP